MTAILLGLATGSFIGLTSSASKELRQGRSSSRHAR